MTYLNANKKLCINMADQYVQLHFFHKNFIHCGFKFPAGWPFRKYFSERNLHFTSAIIFQLTLLPVTYLRVGGKQSILEGILRNPLKNSSSTLDKPCIRDKL